MEEASGWSWDSIGAVQTKSAADREAEAQAAEHHKEAIVKAQVATEYNKAKAELVKKQAGAKAAAEAKAEAKAEAAKAVVDKGKLLRVDDILMWELPRDEIPQGGVAFKVLVATEGSYHRVDATVISQIEDVVTEVLGCHFEVSEVRRSNQSHKALMLSLHSCHHVDFAQKMDAVAGIGGCMAGHWMIVGGEEASLEPPLVEPTAASESKLAAAMRECVEEEIEAEKLSSRKKTELEKEYTQKLESGSRHLASQAVTAAVPAYSRRLGQKKINMEEPLFVDKNDVKSEALTDAARIDTIRRFNDIREEMLGLYPSTRPSEAREQRLKRVNHAPGTERGFERPNRDSPQAKACRRRLERPRDDPARPYG